MAASDRVMVAPLKGRGGGTMGMGAGVRANIIADLPSDLSVIRHTPSTRLRPYGVPRRINARRSMGGVPSGVSLLPSIGDDGGDQEGPINVTRLVSCMTSDEIDRQGRCEIVFLDHGEIDDTATSMYDVASDCGATLAALGWVNAYLCSAEGIRRYGSHRDTEALRRRFRLFGIQATDFDITRKSVPHPAVPMAVTVAGPTASPVDDICAAVGNVATVGQVYYLLLKRFTYDAKLSPLAMATARGVELPDAPTYYWQYVPWTNTAGRIASGPPDYAYNDLRKKGGYEGAMFRLGMVLHVYDTALTADGVVTGAHAAVFPRSTASRPTGRRGVQMFVSVA